MLENIDALALNFETFMTNGADSIEPISSTDLFARIQRGEQRAVTNMCSMARMPSCAAAS